MIRAACIKAALEAYEEGGVLGLCAEGRWEYAISALRQLDVRALVSIHASGSALEEYNNNWPKPSSDPSP